MDTQMQRTIERDTRSLPAPRGAARAFDLHPMVLVLRFLLLSNPDSHPKLRL